MAQLNAHQKKLVANASVGDRNALRNELRAKQQTRQDTRNQNQRPVLPVPNPNPQPVSPIPQPQPQPQPQAADDTGLQPTGNFVNTAWEKGTFDPGGLKGDDKLAARQEWQAAEQARKAQEKAQFQADRQAANQAARDAERGHAVSSPEVQAQARDRDLILDPSFIDRYYMAPGAAHRDSADLSTGGSWQEVMRMIRANNPHLAHIGDVPLMSQFRRLMNHVDSEEISEGEWTTYDTNGNVIGTRGLTGKQYSAWVPKGSQGGGGGGGAGAGGGGGGGFGAGLPQVPGTPLSPLPPPAGNVPPIGTEGVTEQGDTFDFDNDPILGGRIDDLLQGMEGVQESEMRGQIGDAISGILMRDPNADPNVVLDRLANVREQMIPLRESAKQRISTDLARMGLADSPAVMAQALAGVESEINNQITQQWREIVNEEQTRAQEQFQQGINLGIGQEDSDRNFKIQQMDQALQRAGIEAQERLDLIRLANDARQVFNSGRQIDANIALDNLRFNLDFQNFLHSQGMDLAQFQLQVEQARFGNALDLQRTLLQYMGNVQQGFV